MPRGFRPEASAVFLSAAAGHWLRGRWGQGGRALRRGVGLFRSPLKVGAYLVGSTLLGWKGVSTLRLWSNRLRAGRRAAQGR